MRWSGYDGYGYGFRPYVSVAKRKEKAKKHAASLAKKGHACCPVNIEGRKIAATFWGKAWCDNLESYSDFENRLPRGRTYVRNGSVFDLQIEPGRITALVSGSEIYKVNIAIKPLADKDWKNIKAQCAGQIASIVELLQGRLSQGVMRIITSHEARMFPSPREITMNCSCPDWAGMCKHVAAAMYGVGARLDEKPELFFRLRKVDHMDLIEQAGNVQAITGSGTTPKKTIAADALGDVFGIELDDSPTPPSETSVAAEPPPAEPAKPDKPASGRRKKSPAAAAKPKASAKAKSRRAK